MNPNFNCILYSIDVGFLSNFHIESASLVTPTDVVEPADWIETCK